jgi:hypothetical protein
MVGSLRALLSPCRSAAKQDMVSDTASRLPALAADKANLVQTRWPYNPVRIAIWVEKVASGHMG